MKIASFKSSLLFSFFVLICRSCLSHVVLLHELIIMSLLVMGIHVNAYSERLSSLKEVKLIYIAKFSWLRYIQHISVMFQSLS